MLVHWAWRGSHSTVPPRSHAHALHLVIAGVIGHYLVMHGFHGLIKRWRVMICDTFGNRVETYFTVVVSYTVKDVNSTQ